MRNFAGNIVGFNWSWKCMYYSNELSMKLELLHISKDTNYQVHSTIKRIVLLNTNIDVGCPRNNCCDFVLFARRQRRRRFLLRIENWCEQLLFKLCAFVSWCNTLPACSWRVSIHLGHKTIFQVSTLASARSTFLWHRSPTSRIFVCINNVARNCTW